ncbi:polysaccharide pyruvyl transferase family protein [Nocardioides sp.]|uniref:polysaccharide pyruvyl transferase family protein n=1 Tax=Nocardioides sp. TaxID=35761 RepID=UPI002630EB0D|nr:polysaccharide pyruvyl transferase family protein [Nocardioides sp.]
MTSALSIGAYDRFNYGDLLFPHLIDRFLPIKDGNGWHHGATTARDLSEVGGHRVVRSADLLGSASRLLIGGGEVIGARWYPALTYLARSPSDLPLLAAGKVFPDGLLDAIGRRILGGISYLPYLPGREYSSRIPSAANAIGASSLAQLGATGREFAVSSLKEFRYVSTRDSVGRLLLEESGVTDVHLSPDSAALISTVLKFPDGQNDHVTVQVSNAWSRRHASSLSPALARISAEFGLAVRFVPIGLAGGHSDVQGNARVLRGLPKSVPSSQAEPRCVSEIAREIATSRLFIGTSLHGAITAMAYGVPNVCLPGIAKLDAYMSDWGASSSGRPRDVGDLTSACRSVLSVPRVLLDSHSRELGQMAMNNFDAIAAHLD